MKRRTFVRTAALSAFGLSLKPGIAPFAFLHTTGVQQWLRSLVAATSARRRSGALVAAESFRELTNSLNTYFSKRGYEADHSEFYFYNEQESCCFYALKLQHSAAGLSDVLVPVLTRSSDGAWQHVNTITGYQLEALAVAAKALAEHPTPLQQLLLPGNKRGSIPAHIGFSSEQADVAISTRLQGGKAETSIAISDKGQVIFNRTFASRHCLTFATA